MSVRRTLATLASLSVVFVGVAACSSTVDNGSVEDEITRVYSEQFGSDPEDVTCDDTLDAEEGATATCTVTVEGEDHDAGVEVTSVDGDTANFEVDLSQLPAPSRAIQGAEG